MLLEEATVVAPEDGKDRVFLLYIKLLEKRASIAPEDGRRRGITIIYYTFGGRDMI